MGKEIDAKTLAAAKEKLACKIEPTKYADGTTAGNFSHAADTETSKPQTAQDGIFGANGQVLLTRMTTAGG